MALSSRRNSTNVRRDWPLDPWPARAETCSCAPALTLAAWTLFVAIAGIDDVFARLETEAYAALAAFVVVFAVFTSRFDRDAAALLASVRRPLLLALVLDALLLASPVGGIAPSMRWSAFPGALLVLVALPLALVLHAQALRGPRLRKVPGASPGATRAAT